MSVVQALNDFAIDLVKVFTFFVVHNEFDWHFIFLFHEPCFHLFQLWLCVAEDNDVRNVWSWSQAIFEKWVYETNTGSSRNHESGLNTWIDEIKSFCFVIAKFEIDQISEPLHDLFRIPVYDILMSWLVIGVIMS